METQLPFNFKEIRLPEGHLWKGSSTVSMDYPPPASITGECLGIIGHSSDLEHTLNTFYRLIHYWHIPKSGTPEQDFMILSPNIYGKDSFYFSIAEMLSSSGEGVLHDEGWEIFKKLLEQKTREKNQVLKDLKETTEDSVNEILGE